MQCAKHSKCINLIRVYDVLRMMMFCLSFLETMR